MARLSIALTAVVLFGFASVAVAQNSPPPGHPPHKTHAKKVEKANDFSEDWSIAAPQSGTAHADVNEDPNVAAGRKKFFQQSTTLQNGGPASAGGRSGGFTPSAGFSF